MMKQSVKHAKKRLAAGFLAVCILVSQGILPIPVSAEETKTCGLCEHHPEHTAECGYAEEAPCCHEHTDECSRLAEKCVHRHTADCYPKDNTEDAATPSDAEPAGCGHVCSEETGCITKVLDCQHVHDSECGFTEAHACGYVCEICSSPAEEDSGTTEPTKETCSCTKHCSAEQVNMDCPVCKEDYSDCTVKQKPNIAGGIITEFSRLDKDILNQEVESGTALEDLILPDELEVSVYSEDETGESDMITVTTVAVTDWESDPAYDGETGTCVFTPELTDEYPVKEGVKTPKITVTVIPAQANGLMVNITGWEWIDPDEHLSDGALAMPGVNAEKQASFDEVVSLLPEQISAEIEGAAEPETINITGWKCPEYKQDNEENWPTGGSYQFTAVLTEGYMLSESAAMLEIDVLIGTANVLQEGDTGDFIVTGDSAGYVYSADSRTLTVKNSANLTISGNTTQDKIVVESGATAAITLNGLSIDVSGSEEYACAFEMKGANVTLTLADGSDNRLNSGTGSAGMHVPSGAELVILGSGNLTVMAFARSIGAGIGGAGSEDGGCITIGGNARVTATGSGGGAGIGGASAGVNSAVGSGGTITIGGSARVTATGGARGAGIGGAGSGSGGTITISGSAQVTATGGTDSAGIGGGGGLIGSGGAGGTITIKENPIVLATGSGGANIGGGKGNGGGTIGRNGGVIFEGKTGRVYGNVILSDDLEIPEGYTLTIPKDTSLIVGNGVTLTNRGAITVETGGTLKIDNGGIFNNFGTLDGEGTKPDDGSYNNKDSALKLEVSDDPPVYEGTITLTASVSEQPSANAMLRSLTTPKTVFFYCDNKEIGSAVVDPDKKTAELKVELKKPIWTIGEHFITAKYTGSNDQLLPSESAPIMLTVLKVDQPATSVAVSSTAATYGGAAPTITPVSVKDSANVTYSAITSASDSGTISDVANISGTTITLNKAGTFYVRAEIAETDCYNKKIIYSDEIKVDKADSQFTATVKKDSMATNLFIYGDAITVEVSGIQVRTANSRSALSENNVYLFAVDPTGSPDTTNAIASAAVSGGNATLTYNTGGKKIAIGNNQTLWIAYGGSGDLNPVTQTVSVDLAAKPITAIVDSSDSSAQKPYNGNNDFSNVKLKLIGIEGSDTVTADANGTADNSDTGNNKAFTAAAVTLNGADKNWYSLAAGDVSGNVNITKAAGKLEISCADVTYGNTVSPKVTTNTGGGTVTYSYEGRGGTSYRPSAAAPTEAGKYTVTGTAEATANYEQAVSEPVNFEIRKAAGDLVISCADVIYGEKVSPKVTANTGGGTVTYSYEGRDDTSYGPSAEAPTNAGTYKVTGTAEATANHEKATSVSVNFEIRKATGNLAISCADVTYGKTVSPEVTANMGGGTVTYSYEGRDDTSYGPSAEAPTNAGTYKVTGTAEATANYEQAVSEPVNFEIRKATGSLVIFCADVTYGTVVSPSVTSNAGKGAVTYSYEGRGGTSYGPSAEAPTEAGKYTITGTAEATANYEQAVSEPVNFEIRKAAGNLVISCADVIYGKTVSPKVTTNTGGGTVTYSYEGRDDTSYGPSAEAPTEAGKYTVTGTAEATANHEKATSVSVNFEIRKAAGSLEISCADVTYGKTVSPKVTANTGGGTVTYSYEGRDGTGYGPSAEAPTEAGKYTVTGTAEATANYEQAVSEPVNFEIRKAAGDLEISCADVTYGKTVSPKVTANTGGGTVTYSYEGRDGTSYGPSAAAPTEAGKYTVTGTAEATANYEEAVSEPVNFEIRKAAGSLVISCADVTYGKTVSPEVTANTGGGTVTYSYEGRDGTSYGPSAAAPTEAGKYTVTGTAAATANYEEAVSEPVNFEIRKAAGASVPKVTGSYTGDGSSFTYTIEPIGGAEYSRNGSKWQESNVFTDFHIGDAVTFYARMKEDKNHMAGAGSDTGTVIFARLRRTENPALEFVISGATGSKKITITPVDGCEYTFDGGTAWGIGNTQVFATDDSPVIGIRYAQTDTHEASAGVTQKADLTNREQDAPEAFTLTFTNNGNGTFTAKIPLVEGGEYSFDGTNWSRVNTKSDCKPNTACTGYVRLAAKDGYNAGPAVSDTRKTPELAVVPPVTVPDKGSSENRDSGSEQTGVPAPPKADVPTTETIIIGAPDENGVVTISDEQMETAVNNAKRTAGKNGIAIVINLPAGAGNAVLARDSMERLTGSGVRSFKMNFDGVALCFDRAALQEIARKTTGALTFGAGKETGLTGDALAAIGSRPAYNLTVSWLSNGKTAYVSSFGAGRVTVAIAYTPAAEERTGGLYAVRADGGRAEWLTGSGYDQNSRAVIFRTGHFSAYGVGYKTPPAFADTGDHWAKGDIDFAVSRGLFSGTGDTTFSPDDVVMRGMFVKALGRLAGIDPKDYPSVCFADVSAAADYAPYAKWALDSGIVYGTGEKTFSPDAPITREEMAVFLQRYAVSLAYALPAAREAVTFVDESRISGDRRAAVRAVQQAGIMDEKDGRRFAPEDFVTRAEASAMLRRFVTVTTDPALAHGFAQNDVGQWKYYLSGKPVIGWKQLEGIRYYFDAAGVMQAGGWRQIGGKWYYFYTNGVLAVNTKIEEYEIGPDGAGKEN